MAAGSEDCVSALICSLETMLLFNGVNQISANGKKGQTPQKLTKQEEQDD